LDASQVPVVYQLLKSVVTAPMALAEVVGPYVDNARRQIMARLDARQSQPHANRRSTASMRCRWNRGRRDNNRTILQNNIAFMDELRRKGVIRFTALEAFGKSRRHSWRRTCVGGADASGALDDGACRLENPTRRRLDRPMRQANTIYVRAPRNNVLFSVLAQSSAPTRSIAACC